MDPDLDWKTRLLSFERIPLAETPTPFERLPRLSQQLGCDIYIKRDDELGPGLGGNKTRKLEFLLAEAQARGLRKIATFGGLQSNHVRITAAAARKLGLDVHIFYFERRPPQLTGNLLLNQILGAQMHFIPLGTGSSTSLNLETTIRLVRWLARFWIGPHYFIPVGGHHWLGCLGYVLAALEISEQAQEADIENACVVTAAGSGGTLAGLMAGFGLIGSSLTVLGIDVGKLWKNFPTSITRLAEEISSKLGKPLAFENDRVPLIENTYVGPKYGIPSQLGLDAMQYLAQKEGLLLDPIYTAKAFAGMLDLVRSGKLGNDKPLIFLHTGGLPALFAFELE